MNLVVEATRRQDRCWEWVDHEIDTLNTGVKEIIDIFTTSPEPSILKKLMIMTQKLSQNVELIKCNHE